MLNNARPAMLPTILATAALGVVLSPDARADQAWLCSVASAVAVDEDGTVGPPDFSERERPTFFRVDAARRELTLLAPASRRGEVTKVEMVHECEGVRLFSGVEHGRGVSLIITDAGHMTLSIVSDGAVWSVFGHALPDERPVAAEQSPADEQPVADELPSSDEQSVADEPQASDEEPEQPEAAEAGPGESPSPE